MGTLYLCGAGNSEGVRLALRVNEAKGRWRRIVLLDDDPRKWGAKLLGIPVLGAINKLSEADAATDEVVNLVARKTHGRATFEEKLASYGIPFATLVHPSVDGLGCKLGEGVLVYEHAVISPEVRIGDGSVVFMRAIVGHESTVGCNCVIAAGSVLNARVRLDDEVYVGTNASILPEISVGRGATIGSNTAVIGDVPAAGTVIGVPGTILQEAPAHEEPASENQHIDRGLEQALLTVWREALKAPDLGPIQNFFDAGGTSLLALQVLPAMRAATGFDFQAMDLFRFPCVRRLAAHASSKSQAAQPAGPFNRGTLRRELTARRLGQHAI